MRLSGAIRIALPTAWMTSMGLLRGSRNATALSEGESVPSPKMPTLIMPCGFSASASASWRLAFSRDATLLDASRWRSVKSAAGMPCRFSLIHLASHSRTTPVCRSAAIFLDLSTVFIKAMTEFMGALSRSSPRVAPPMARVNAKPRRKSVDVRARLPLLCVLAASVLAAW